MGKKKRKKKQTASGRKQSSAAKSFMMAAEKLKSLNDSEKMDSIDQAIDTLCNQIQERAEYEPEVSIGFAEALAALVTAKADLNMSVRMHDRGCLKSNPVDIDSIVGGIAEKLEKEYQAMQKRVI